MAPTPKVYPPCKATTLHRARWRTVFLAAAMLTVISRAIVPRSTKKRVEVRCPNRPRLQKIRPRSARETSAVLPLSFPSSCRPASRVLGHGVDPHRSPRIEDRLLSGEIGFAGDVAPCEEIVGMGDIERGTAGRQRQLAGPVMDPLPGQSANDGSAARRSAVVEELVVHGEEAQSARRLRPSGLWRTGP